MLTPAVLAVIFPSLEIVATDVLEDVHVTALFVALAGKTVAARV